MKIMYKSDGKLYKNLKIVKNDEKLKKTMKKTRVRKAQGGFRFEVGFCWGRVSVCCFVFWAGHNHCFTAGIIGLGWGPGALGLGGPRSQQQEHR
jgi:hypothetical protein